MRALIAACFASSARAVAWSNFLPLPEPHFDVVSASFFQSPPLPVIFLLVGARDQSPPSVFVLKTQTVPEALGFQRCETAVAHRDGDAPHCLRQLAIEAPDAMM